MHSRDHKVVVGVAHKLTSPKNQPQFSQTMMGQVSNKLLDRPKTPSDTAVATEISKKLFNRISTE